jgi:ubiquinone/menaquinone biosynthesis C-methylase UbiE
MSSLSEKERKIRTLIETAKDDIEADNLKEAGEKIHQAIKLAKNMGNEQLLNEIDEFIKGFTYRVETQSIELSPIESDGFILDVGGGGQGIIGKLNGKQVVAIDKNERELEETQNEALKIVMDATDLRFLSHSFDVCTSFFSLMYVPKSSHLKVFKEAHRVLKDKGRLLLWDVKIPDKFEDYKAFMVRLRVRLPHEEIEVGYGVKWQEQNIEYFKELAEKAKFKISNEWNNGEIFYLEMSKEE